jgi:hypothetical protein
MRKIDDAEAEADAVRKVRPAPLPGIGGNVLTLGSVEDESSCGGLEGVERKIEDDKGRNGDPDGDAADLLASFGVPAAFDADAESIDDDACCPSTVRHGEEAEEDDDGRASDELSPLPVAARGVGEGADERLSQETAERPGHPDESGGLLGQGEREEEGRAIALFDGPDKLGAREYGGQCSELRCRELIVRRGCCQGHQRRM